MTKVNLAALMFGFSVAACVVNPSEGVSSASAVTERPGFDWNAAIPSEAGEVLGITTTSNSWPDSERITNQPLTNFYIDGVESGSYAPPLNVVACRLSGAIEPQMTTPPEKIYSAMRAAGVTVKKREPADAVRKVEHDTLLATIRVERGEGGAYGYFIICTKNIAATSKAARAITFQEMVNAFWGEAAGARMLFREGSGDPQPPSRPSRPSK